jgi:hypothetical protein
MLATKNLYRWLNPIMGGNEMEEKALVLADLLLNDDPSVQKQPQESEQVAGLCEQLKMVPNIPFEKILPDLMEEARKVLDVSVKDILLGSLKSWMNFARTSKRAGEGQKK